MPTRTPGELPRIGELGMWPSGHLEFALCLGAQLVHNPPPGDVAALPSPMCLVDPCQELMSARVPTSTLNLKCPCLAVLAGEEKPPDRHVDLPSQLNPSSPGRRPSLRRNHHHLGNSGSSSTASRHPEMASWTTLGKSNASLLNRQRSGKRGSWISSGKRTPILMRAMRRVREGRLSRI